MPLHLPHPKKGMTGINRRQISLCVYVKVGYADRTIYSVLFIGKLRKGITYFQSLSFGNPVKWNDGKTPNELIRVQKVLLNELKQRTNKQSFSKIKQSKPL